MRSTPYSVDLHTGNSIQSVTKDRFDIVAADSSALFSGISTGSNCPGLLRNTRSSVRLQGQDVGRCLQKRPAVRFHCVQRPEAE